MTPLLSSHDSSIPLNCAKPNLVPFTATLHRLLHAVHVFDLGVHAYGNQVALQLPICCEHAILDREGLRPQTKCTNLLIVWKLWIDGVERRLYLFRARSSRDDDGEVAAPIAHDNDLLHIRKVVGDFVFKGFRGNLVARPEDDQILDSADDTPVPRSIHFALIAGVKPSVAQGFRSLLRTVPIAWKNIRATHYDFVILAETHLDA